MTPPTTGELAPDFELPGDDGRSHRLSDRRGHWTIVYFYPADDTPGCTTQACDFRDGHRAIAEDDAEVWGISPDDAASHLRFRAKFDLPFTLLCDTDHGVAEAYGAWGLKTLYGREYLGIIRSSFLIGPDLRIVRHWPKVKADGHAEEVRDALRAARSGAAC